jgi:hypothetical protein
MLFGEVYNPLFVVYLMPIDDGDVPYHPHQSSLEPFGDLLGQGFTFGFPIDKFDLDDLVILESLVDFLDDVLTQPVLPNPDPGLQVVSKAC